MTTWREHLNRWESSSCRGSITPNASVRDFINLIETTHQTNYPSGAKQVIGPTSEVGKVIARKERLILALFYSDSGV